MEVIGRLRGSLQITCHVCGHAALWSQREASARLGDGCTVPRARRRLKCSRCGERKVNFAVGKLKLDPPA
jgi:ribosomal protein S27E